jgi:hypothetical protein
MVLMLLAIGYQVRQRARRVAAGLPAVSPPTPTMRRLRIILLVVLALIAIWIIVVRLQEPGR